MAGIVGPTKESRRPREGVRRRRGRASSRRSFTLVELIIVLLIIGVAAAVAMPDLRAVLAGARIDSASQDTIRAIRGAQDLAVLTASPHAVIFDLWSSRCAVISVTGQWLTVLVGDISIDPISKASWIVCLADRDVTLTYAQNDDGRPWVLFDSMGNAEAALTVTLTCGAKSRTLSVARGTGVVTTQ